jgi:hypothetical protein
LPSWVSVQALETSRNWVPLLLLLRYLFTKLLTSVVVHCYAIEHILLRGNQDLIPPDFQPSSPASDQAVVGSRTYPARAK